MKSVPVERLEELAKICEVLKDHPQIRVEEQYIHGSYARRFRALIASATEELQPSDEVIARTLERVEKQFSATHPEEPAGLRVSIGKDDDGYFVAIDGPHKASIWLGERGPIVMAALEDAFRSALGKDKEEDAEDPQGANRRTYWLENDGSPLVVVDGKNYPLNAGFDRINALLADDAAGLRDQAFRRALIWISGHSPDTAAVNIANDALDVIAALGKDKEEG